LNEGGGDILAKEHNIDLLGSIPIDMNLSESEDEGVSFISTFPDSISAKHLKTISETILKKIGEDKMEEK
jgi:ATP-binding protein involved in chromosome partitioning